MVTENNLNYVTKHQKVLSSAWHKDNTEKIRHIYSKSSDIWKLNC